MALIEKTKSRNDIYKGRIVTVHVDEALLSNGKTALREVVDHPGGVCVGALNEKDELIFVRQFRYPYQEIVLELPAGKLEKGEDPFDAMKRELKEETGCEGSDFVSLGELYPSPGYCGEIIRLWSCRIKSSGESCPDEDEFLEVEKIPFDEAVEKVMSGEIKDAKTQAIVLKMALQRNVR